MSMQPPPDGPNPPEVPSVPPAYPVSPSTVPQTGYPVAAPLATWRAPGPAPGLAYAGFGRRFLGYILDVILLFVIEAVVTIPLVFVPVINYYHDHPPAAGQTVVTLPTDLSNRFILLGLLGAVVSAVYFGGLVAWQGRTVGQRAAGTFVVRVEDGGRLPMGRAYLRAAIFWVPGVLGVLPAAGQIAGLVALIGLLSVAWDQRKQGWHDKLARSLVLKRVPT
ncbi:MAG TPA: RDD family protein [Candidatus Dormibacteraeota bacterium]|jgi:uncharacterized RDD family membrane protein YckC